MPKFVPNEKGRHIFTFFFLGFGQTNFLLAGPEEAHITRLTWEISQACFRLPPEVDITITKPNLEAHVPFH